MGGTTVDGAANTERASPGRVARLVAVAGIAATTQIALTIAKTSLVFRDELAVDLGLGLAAMFCGLLITGVVAALRSGLAGHVVAPQDSGLVVLSVLMPAIIAATSAEATAETAIALMGLSSIAVGIVMTVLGRFGLGRMVRYLPYPVLAGFLAGTGLVMAEATIELAASGITGEAGGGGERVGRLALAIGLAVAVAVVSRSRLSTERLVPVVVVGSIAGFHLVRLLVGMTRADGAARGWLLPELPAGALLGGDSFRIVERADWGTVVEQLPAMSPILLLAPLTMLLYLGALESMLDVELDVDREFQTVGVVNVIAGGFGSAPSYTQFANTMLVQRMGGRRRSIPVAVAVSALAVLVFGDALVALVPQPVVAGMLGFIAVSFLLDWIWDLRRRVGRVELAMAILIALSILLFDFLAGIGIGLVLAAGWFVVQYSATSGVRGVRDAVALRSNVSRPAADDRRLGDSGAEVVVVELEGFLFFGTGDSVLRAVEAQPAVGRVGWLLIDGSRVTGADSSAAASFGHLVRWADRIGVVIGWCGLRSSVLRSLSPMFDDARAGRRFVDVDHALEWTETSRLAAAAVEQTAEDPAGLLERLPRLREMGRHVEYAPGDSVLTAGDPSLGLTILERGRVSVLGGAPGSRRRQLGRGSVLGELGLYRDLPAASGVIADEACSVVIFDRELLARLERTEPELATAIHRFVAVTLAVRLDRANAALDALDER